MAGLPPLTGLKVLELAGLAPGPFAGVIFADAGADVLRIDRAVPGRSHSADPSAKPPRPTEDQLSRRKTSIAVDLKSEGGVALVQQLARSADVLIDPYRPGVLERLGLGPDELLAANPRLIYARLSGFRRDGRYRDMAGHDINYLAVSGVLGLLGRSGEKPTPPWNILADFAGGGLMLALGVLLALMSRSLTGKGQVVESSMVDGVSYLASYPRFAQHTPHGNKPRGQNLLDSGCPFYDTYACADADASADGQDTVLDGGCGYMAVGALEPQFFAQLQRGLRENGAADDFDEKQKWDTRRQDSSQWPALREALTAAFRRHPRAHWERVFDGTDACCTPVLTFAEIEKSRAGASSSSSSSHRESDQRPPVTLRSTPLLAVTEERPTAAGADSSAADEASGSRRGQGPGVPGAGYLGQQLYPGEGGEEALKRWQGWARGTEYDVENGGVVLKQKSHL